MNVLWILCLNLLPKNFLSLMRICGDDLDDSNSKKTNKKDADTSFVLSGLGDILCSKSQSDDAFNKDSNSYDFSYLFENVKYYTQTSDLVIGNLETTFAGGDNGFSNYISPDELAYNLKSIGVNVLTTANDHSLNSGFNGLTRTIDVLNKADISHVGTYKSQEERDGVLFKYVKGLKIAILNYTYNDGSLNVPNDKSFCVNVIDKDLISSDISRAKEQNADVIVACMHWGNSFEASPNDDQKNIADFLLHEGVDVIFGNNPNVLQPMEKRSVILDDGSQKDGFVAYSLGNFIGNQEKNASKCSVILNVKLSKHVDGGLTIDGADYVPIYMFKNSSGSNSNGARASDASVSISSGARASNAVGASDAVGAHLFKLLDIERSIQAYDAGDVSIGSENYELLKSNLDFIKRSIGEEF